MILSQIFILHQFSALVWYKYTKPHGMEAAIPARPPVKQAFAQLLGKGLVLWWLLTVSQ